MGWFFILFCPWNCLPLRTSSWAKAKNSASKVLHFQADPSYSGEL